MSASLCRPIPRRVVTLHGVVVANRQRNLTWRRVAQLTANLSVVAFNDLFTHSANQLLDYTAASGR